ncbi:MAG: NB-ARC domain-containing protein [Thermoanaerobaculia bacterium]
MEVALDLAVRREDSAHPSPLGGGQAQAQAARFSRASSLAGPTRRHDTREAGQPGAGDPSRTGEAEEAALSPCTPSPPTRPPQPASPSIGADFKGREAALEALAQSLEGGGAAALVQAKALHGLGGVGKTRLAVEYARRFGQRYRAAFFVPAESPEALQAGLARLGQEDLLALPLDGKEEAAAARAVLGWLRKNSRWLLILDNVDTEAAQQAVRELLGLDQGHVLVTSRLSGWPKGVEKLEVAVLEGAAAVALLLASTEGSRRPDDDDEAQAGKLAELLGGLPLALELAGAYIATQRIGFAAYLTAWEKDRARVLAWYEASETAYPFSVAITWSRTVQQLHRPARALLPPAPTWPRSRWPWPWWMAGRNSSPSASSGSRRRKATRPAQHPSPQPPLGKPSPSSPATRW